MNKFTDFPSGLMTDFDFYVKDGKFGRDAKYNNGQTTQLFLTGNAIKDGVLVAEDHEERWNCPPGWSSIDDGLTVIHEGTAENFSNKSQIAKLFLKVSEVAPDLVAEWIEMDASPQESVIWINTGWHMKEVTEGEGNFKSTRNYPTAFLGKVDAPSPSEGNGAGSEADFIEKLRPLAKAHDTHEDFVNEAIALDGISQYSNLVKRIADPDDLYAELRG